MHTAFSPFKAKRQLGLLLAVLTFYGAFAVAQVQELYRYKDENGTEVINHFIPPKYAQNGYEILNNRGDVIRIIAPAPTQEELSKRHIIKEFEKLYRRYRSIDEIERAKQRGIVSIESSIAILRSNITMLDDELDGQIERAATAERQGRDVPNHVLELIDSTKVELNITNELLNKRLADRDKEIKIHEDYKKLFVKGHMLKREEFNPQR